MQHVTGSFMGLHHTELFTQHWLPDDSAGKPRALVVLAHGIAEHGGRYEHVAAHLTAHGYALYALDHRGHGRSQGTRVHVDTFDHFVMDLTAYVEQVRATAPDLPVFVYGHSMGSLIALLYAFQQQDRLAGLITTGTALALGGSNALLAGVVRLLGRVAPKARIVPALDLAGLSRDEAVQTRYAADPLVVTGPVRVGMVAKLLTAGMLVQHRLPTLRLPFLALHGAADPVCLPVATEIIQARSGSPDTTVTRYPDFRHEIHNEIGHEQVLADITAWLDAHV